MKAAPRESTSGRERGFRPAGRRRQAQTVGLIVITGNHRFDFLAHRFTLQESEHPCYARAIDIRRGRRGGSAPRARLHPAARAISGLAGTACGDARRRRVLCRSLPALPRYQADRRGPENRDRGQDRTRPTVMPRLRRLRRGARRPRRRIGRSRPSCPRSSPGIRPATHLAAPRRSRSCVCPSTMAMVMRSNASRRRSLRSAVTPDDARR